MEVAVEENGTVRHRRRAGLVVAVAVGGEKGQAIPLHQGVVRHDGEFQYHLVHFAVTVAPDSDDFVLHGVELLGHRRAVVLLRQMVPGTVVEQVPQQQQFFRALRLEGVHQLFHIVAGPVEVRSDHQFHGLSSLQCCLQYTHFGRIFNGWGGKTAKYPCGRSLSVVY